MPTDASTALALTSSATSIHESVSAGQGRAGQCGEASVARGIGIDNVTGNVNVSVTVTQSQTHWQCECQCPLSVVMMVVVAMVIGHYCSSMT